MPRLYLFQQSVQGTHTGGNFGVQASPGTVLAVVLSPPAAVLATLGDAAASSFPFLGWGLLDCLSRRFSFSPSCKFQMTETEASVRYNSNL